VLADDLMLNRVLSNLLDNAIKFSPAGRIGGGGVAPGAQDGWHLQVRDAGIGHRRRLQADDIRRVRAARQRRA
jgi:signal transduction histidine kinase